MNIPLNIDWQQILLHLFNFGILAGGLYLLLYKPVKAFMEQREAHYKKMEDDAASKLTEASKLKCAYEDKLSNADEEIKQNRKESLAKTQAMADEEIARAKEKADKIIKDAKADIEREHEKMLQDTKKEVAELAVEATRKLLEQSADDPYGTFLKNVDGGGADDRA